jgi:hypothetical protein
LDVWKAATSGDLQVACAELKLDDTFLGILQGAVDRIQKNPDGDEEKQIEIDIEQVLCGFLIGHKGETVQRLMSESHAKIGVNEKTLQVIVRGSAQAVDKAATLISAKLQCEKGASCLSVHCPLHHSSRLPLCQDANCKETPCHDIAGSLKLHPLANAELLCELLAAKTFNKVKALQKHNAAFKAFHVSALEGIATSLNRHGDALLEARFSIQETARRQTRSGISSKGGELAARKAEVNELVNQREQFEARVLKLFNAGHIPKMVIRREMFRLCPFQSEGGLRKYTKPLPALALRREVEEKVLRSPVVIVQGATGSGKSTQLPAYLASLPEAKNKVIACTQPRKIAATGLADRVNFEFSGGDPKALCNSYSAVGYNVGGRRAHGKHTQILYMTEGVLLNELLSRGNSEGGNAATSSQLRRYAAVVVDEAHERSINTDLILGLLKTAMLDQSGDMPKVIVTSATLERKKFVDYFEKSGIKTEAAQIPGRMFPVDVQYAPISEHRDVVEPVAQQAVDIHLNAVVTKDGKACHDGDILAFLPGADEVERARQFAEKRIKRAPKALPYTILTLYGKQPPEEQKRVFEKSARGERKIIFSTNIAETSVTVDGVTHVVDSGLEKEAVFDQQKGMTSLRTQTISQSSAEQRKGRAGRTAPGRAYRMVNSHTCRFVQHFPTIIALCTTHLNYLRHLLPSPSTPKMISLP